MIKRLLILLGAALLSLLTVAATARSDTQPIDRDAAAAPAVAPPAILLPGRPELSDEFISPFGVISTTTAYEDQWNIITNDTRYGVRNLSLPGSPRKCWGVTWPRMLHSALDLYRRDGQDAAGTPLVAVADGSVAYYNPAYNSYPGRVVILSHPLRDGRTIYSMYAHLGSVSVTQGQIVVRGQPIGTVLYQAGDSHLHFEMRWFLDGTWIYPSSTACNGIVYGRGYTYLIHPDDFPAIDHGYVDPDAFIQAHGGPPLTPIGLPDPRGPALTVQAASADVQLGAEQPPIDRAPLVVRPSPFDLGGPDVDGIAATIKTEPALLDSVPITAPINVLIPSHAPTPAPTTINTDTLTYNTYLPLIVCNFPRQEPACVEGQDLLTNGGFEGGPGSAPWVQVKNWASDLIGSARSFSGTYSVWLGGRATADEEVLQSFIVPYYTEAVTLTFKRQLSNAQGSDHFEAVLENTVGNEIAPQVVFNALSPNQAVWANETIVFGGLSAWGKRSMRLSVKGTTYNTASSFFVDEISLRTRCAP